MAKKADLSVGYGNVHYYRAGGRSRRRRSRVLTFVPTAVLVALAWFGFSWYQGVLSGEQDCAPFCGILPGPGGPSEQAVFDAAKGWRVSYRVEYFGQPYREDDESVEWRFDADESVGLTSVPETDPETICANAASAMPKGFELLYDIPNAGIGDRVGQGAAFEKTVARPGKAPLRLRRFQLCVAVGEVGLLGYAEGPRQRTAVVIHADPATTRTAFLLGELAAGVEYVDENDKPLA